MPSGIDPDEARRARGEADFLTGRALKLAPDNDEVKKLRDRRTDRRKWNRGFESHPFRLPMKLALRLLKLTVKLQVFLWGFEPRRLRVLYSRRQNRIRDKFKFSAETSPFPFLSTRLDDLIVDVHKKTTTIEVRIR